MAKQKTRARTRAAARRAPVSPATINITQNIDARGDISLPRFREILARSNEQLQSDIARAFGHTSTAKAVTAAPSQTIVRFWKVGADGYVLPDLAKDWEGVYDASTKLIWGRRLLAGEHTHADAIKAAAAATLCGQPARAPTIQERLSIVDYSRTEPALNIDFFEPSEKNGWEWTSTPAAAPSGYAWLVNLGNGYSYRDGQSNRYHVRAVRAGQPLGFEF